MELALRRGNSNPLMRLQDEMGDLFGRFLGDRDTFWGERSFWPPIDIAEEDKAYVVRVEVPGCKVEDIEVSVIGSTLTITGTKKEKTEEKKEAFYHVESRHGTFRRDLTLPHEVDTAKVTAKCEDGILIVTVPKSEKSVAKRVNITT